VDLFIAYYTTQRHGAELISSKNRISDSWARAAGGRHSVVVDGRTQPLDRMRLIYRGRDKRVVYRWYWIDGSVTASPYLAKLLQATGQLLAGDAPAATVIISAPYDELEGEADGAIEDFLQSVQPISPFLREFARRG
jgi:EpsI family protein